MTEKKYGQGGIVEKIRFQCSVVMPGYHAFGLWRIILRIFSFYIFLLLKYQIIGDLFPIAQIYSAEKFLGLCLTIIKHKTVSFEIKTFFSPILLLQCGITLKTIRFYKSGYLTFEFDLCNFSITN